MFRSIKTRLTLVICGILLFVFLIQLAVNYLFAEKYYIFQKSLLLKEVYHQMKVLSEKAGSIDEVIAGIDADNNVEIILVDNDKNLVYSNRPESKPEIKPENMPDNLPEDKQENKAESDLVNNPETESVNKDENELKEKSENVSENSAEDELENITEDELENITVDELEKIKEDVTENIYENVSENETENVSENKKENEIVNKPDNELGSKPEIELENKPNYPEFQDKSRDGAMDISKYSESLYQTSEPTIIDTDKENGGKLTLLGLLTVRNKNYYLLIQLPVKSISREMSSTNRFIVYTSLVAMLMGGVFVYFIARQFTKPIEEINKVTLSVANMDFNARARVSNRRDEIGSLETNINLMADRLQENIASLQEANRKLEYDNEYMNRVDEQRKELIANISHELKTPLAILGGYAEMLGNDIPGIDKTFYYETIQDETHKMNVMIQNLLNLSNMENRLTEMQPQELDFVELCDRIYRKSTILMKNRGIISEFIWGPCGKVLADPHYLEEAIHNYIANAIQYTEPGHKIIIKIEEKNQEAILSVFNEGITIQEDHMEKIWNSFYREDKSRSRTSQNNIGLGLYIVRSIVNAHQGSCGVRNKENGVEFWLSLKVM